MGKEIPKGKRQRPADYALLGGLAGAAAVFLVTRYEVNRRCQESYDQGVKDATPSEAFFKPCGEVFDIHIVSRAGETPLHPFYVTEETMPDWPNQERTEFGIDTMSDMVLYGATNFGKYNSFPSTTMKPGLPVLIMRRDQLRIKLYPQARSELEKSRTQPPARVYR